MDLGGIRPGTAALDLVRSAIGARATQDEVQVALTKKSLDAMKVEGEAAVKLIEAAGRGQFVNVRA